MYAIRSYYGFGSHNLKQAFFLVKFLEDVGYSGSRHFDAHAYRTEDYEGVKAFARGNMRTYLILKDKAARWNADPEIQALVAEVNAGDPDLGRYAADYSADRAAARARVTSASVGSTWARMWRTWKRLPSFSRTSMRW